MASAEAMSPCAAEVTRWISLQAVINVPATPESIRPPLESRL